MVSLGVIGYERDRFGEIGNGSIVEALLAERNTAIVVDVGVIRLECDSLGVIGNSAVEVSFDLLRIATVVVSTCQISTLPVTRYDHSGTSSDVVVARCFIAVLGIIGTSVH